MSMNTQCMQMCVFKKACVRIRIRACAHIVPACALVFSCESFTRTCTLCLPTARTIPFVHKHQEELPISQYSRQKFRAANYFTSSYDRSITECQYNQPVGAYSSTINHRVPIQPTCGSIIIYNQPVGACPSRRAPSEGCQSQRLPVQSPSGCSTYGECPASREINHMYRVPRLTVYTTAVV